MTPFVQLNVKDCQYLLELIDEMDSGIEFTARQRSFTRPKLLKIKDNPSKTRLAFQDTQYLLELIEDDELEETRTQRELTFTTLCAIRDLQIKKFKNLQDVEQQRMVRRTKRAGVEVKASV